MEIFREFSHDLVAYAFQTIKPENRRSNGHGKGCLQVAIAEHGFNGVTLVAPDRKEGLPNFQSTLMNPEQPCAKKDIEDRVDIERLVNAFYGRVRKDEVLGFIFEDIAQVDWEAHLPRMYSFWERVLFGTGDFRGNPLAAHARLTTRTEMGRAQFDHWVRLFHGTIGDLFEGERAEHLKRCAEDMANVIYSRINAVPDPRFDPANLTPEQRERYRNYRDGTRGAEPTA